MARTTNTDTLPFVDSRFELGILATQRVRDLNGGMPPVVDVERDKPGVVALREIASGKLDMNQLRHEFVESYKEGVNLEDGVESSAENPIIKELESELLDAVIDEPAELESELNEAIAEAEESAE
ncbi:MAG: DNA-directed RNA polymerase subunit omega [Rickettsiales bacterium]|jgi:DNA-directed RNA polymerase subunit omega|nr:DNA-directed RNA polymerase subunit omega [Rickettsiales bacterium]